MGRASLTTYRHNDCMLSCQFPLSIIIIKIIYLHNTTDNKAVQLLTVMKFQREIIDRQASRQSYRLVIDSGCFIDEETGWLCYRSPHTCGYLGEIHVKTLYSNVYHKRSSGKVCGLLTNTNQYSPRLKTRRLGHTCAALLGDASSH